MLGSYAFFFFQAITILVAATLCKLLLHQQQRHAIPGHEWQFRPAMHLFRFRFAVLIVALAGVFGILFVAKDYPLPISRYAVQVIYTQCEVIVIACYVLFVGSYAVDIHQMIRDDKLRLAPPAAPAAARQAGRGLRQCTTFSFSLSWPGRQRLNVASSWQVIHSCARHHSGTQRIGRRASARGRIVRRACRAAFNRT